MMTAIVTLISGATVVVGAYRAIALGEQYPARALLTFGGIVLLINVSVWIAQRLGEEDCSDE